MVPDWIWFVFIFTFGCCIGSFLNVVIYRLPREKSIVSPPSACPGCGQYIRFYDNIPLISWLVLGRKCRFCKTPISPRYFIIELLTGLVFVGLFFIYFRSGLNILAKPTFQGGGWYVYLLHIVMLAALIAASAIDLELWIIPLSICWFVTMVGFVGSAAGAYLIDFDVIRQYHEYHILPSVSSGPGAIAAGAAAGLIISMILIATGLLKRSYESQITQEAQQIGEAKKKQADNKSDFDSMAAQLPDENFNHRLEVMREILFLLPIIAASLGFYWLTSRVEPVSTWWTSFSQKPAVAGFLGSLLGYFVGCGVVWGIRIFGTLGFGKEAMGLGDVHLMGAAGAVIGPVFIVVAFFIAPFFGLAWAGCQMFFKKIRQIPYGPFLSLGIFVVMILHNWIDGQLFVFYH
jgi:leader peptidase (prepilin peptidase) / N-methyltransferase